MREEASLRLVVYSRGLFVCSLGMRFGVVLGFFRGFDCRKA